MAAGIQELLLLALIILVVLLLPRITARVKNETIPSDIQRPQLPFLTGRQRLFIVISLIWPAVTALYFSPWVNGWKHFVIIGLGPVVLGWSIAWVITGFKDIKKR